MIIRGLLPANLLQLRAEHQRLREAQPQATGLDRQQDDQFLRIIFGNDIKCLKYPSTAIYYSNKWLEEDQRHGSYWQFNSLAKPRHQLTS